jgi:tRNA (guanine-N7-)-methyltransferase
MRAAPPTNLLPYFRTVDEVLAESGDGFRWSQLFEGPHPVELDVGCGRGLFLFNSALSRPQVNILGLEIDYTEGRRAARRLQKRGFPHARVLGGDAFLFLRKLAPAHSVSAIHVYFPDPWWKSRHRKRRVFTDVFVDLCAQALVPGGCLHSWTDVEEYFGVIRALMHHHELFDSLPVPIERPAAHDLDYQTSFERKKRQLGCPIYRGCWRRRPLSTAADAPAPRSGG